MSQYFNVNFRDWARGLTYAVASAVIATAYQLVTTQDLDIFSADWKMIGMQVANVAVITLVSYMATSLLKDENGTIHTPLGKIK